VSFGVAVYPEDGIAIEALFQAADRALYRMKQLEKTPGSTHGITDPVSRS
jgi:GGDEF domain-containing protein